MRPAEDIIKGRILLKRAMPRLQTASTPYCGRKGYKTEIRQAVEKLFQVKVLKVNTVNYKGKRKRLGVHEGFNRIGKRQLSRLIRSQTGNIFD